MMVQATIEKKKRITITAFAIGPAERIIPMSPPVYMSALEMSILRVEITTKFNACKGKKNPLVGCQGEGGYYEKLVEVNFVLSDAM
jgi:hypothetical protein